MKLLKEFPGKHWSETGLRKILNKMDDMGDANSDTAENLTLSEESDLKPVSA